MIKLSLCLKTWQTNNLATCYYKLQGILAGCAMSVVTEKQAGYSERKASCTSFSVWLCARSQPAAVFTQGPWHSGPVTPTGPWHQPGAKPKRWQKAAKKTTNNRHVPHLFLAWAFLQKAKWEPQPKETISSICNCQLQKVVAKTQTDLPINVTLLATIFETSAYWFRRIKAKHKNDI